MFTSVITPEMHYDDWARQYDSDVEGWDYNAPDRVFEKVSNVIRAHKGPMRILDVGIGTGILSRKCRTLRNDLQVAGVDISSNMLAVCARRGVADTLHRLDVSCESLPFEDGVFDLALASGLMENIENIGNAVREMTRVTRPGGLVAFTYMPAARDPLREKLAKKMRPGRTAEGRFVLGELNLFRHNRAVVEAHARAAGAVPLIQETFVGYRTYVFMTVHYDIFVARKIQE